MTDYPKYPFETEAKTKVAKALMRRIQRADQTLELGREIAVFLFDDLNRVIIVAKALSGDLQAAIAIFEELLPGWVYKVCRCHLSDDAWVIPDRNDPKHGARLNATLGPCERQSGWSHGFDVDLRPPRGPYPAAALLVATIGGVDVARARVMEYQKQLETQSI